MFSNPPLEKAKRTHSRQLTLPTNSIFLETANLGIGEKYTIKRLTALIATAHLCGICSNKAVMVCCGIQDYPVWLFILQKDQKIKEGKLLAIYQMKFTLFLIIQLHLALLV